MQIRLQKILVCLLVFVLSISLYQIISTANKEPQVKPAVPIDTTTTPIVTEPIQPTPTLFQTPYKPKPVTTSTDTLLEQFNSGWSILNKSGFADGALLFDTKSLSITNAGDTFDALSLYRGGIPLIKGSTYEFQFEVSSSMPYLVQALVMDETTQDTIASLDVSTTSTPTTNTLSFTWNKDSIYTGQIGFHLGNGKHLPVDDSLTLTFTNIRYTNTNSNTWIHDITTNQVGYAIGQEKHCTFPFDDGDFFDVVNAETNEVVFTAPIIHRLQETITNETTYYGDFTNFNEVGRYYLRSQIGGVSYPFEIKENIYQPLTTDILHTLYLQRCGQDLHCSTCKELNHTACHTSLATLYGVPDVFHDVTGGWHDAGDFGRYVTTGAKTILDLLYAYSINPTMHMDDTNTPNSSNGVPDILDEARYELEWLFKMQDSDGNVYSKVVTESFSSENNPTLDNQALYLTETDTQATGYFVSAMALSSILYEPYDKAFANQCLTAAKKAYEALVHRESKPTHPNPEPIKNGVYMDDIDLDERFNAASFLYVATKDTNYLDSARSLYNDHAEQIKGLSWKNSGYYGMYLLATNKDLKTIDATFQTTLKDALLKDADYFYGIANGSNYRPALYLFIESNGGIAENGIVLAMAYTLTGDQNYLKCANEQLDYLLGNNPLNFSFVTGYGTNYPKDIHHRVCKDRNTQLKGALVSGAEMSPRDPLALALTNVPDCKRYVDAYDSYTTNEISIYWNSDLLSLITFTTIQ